MRYGEMCICAYSVSHNDTQGHKEAMLLTVAHIRCSFLTRPDKRHKSMASVTSQMNLFLKGEWGKNDIPIPKCTFC
ncbi:hypothetical protein XELAEV_18039366mg [Xenopus laevis]|uniref:Uncharacterized protein n=1 Tax=Xenopus laevis TaxID=8355 RepID=A0A974C8R8_XENLA|nr:hypothetical protein XELAEV_18039366mg [Xenopus laevis]